MTTEKINADFRGIIQASKVLILNDTPEISVNFLGRHGIDDYLLKPIQPSLLLEKIRYLTAL